MLGVTSTSEPGRESRQIQMIRDILEAALECQRDRNACWEDVSKLLLPYTFDTCPQVQRTAFAALAGTLSIVCDLRASEVKLRCSCNKRMSI